MYSFFFHFEILCKDWGQRKIPFYGIFFFFLYLPLLFEKDSPFLGDEIFLSILTSSLLCFSRHHLKILSSSYSLVTTPDNVVCIVKSLQVTDKKNKNGPEWCGSVSQASSHKVIGWIPSRGTFLDCRFGSQSGCI